MKFNEWIASGENSKIIITNRVANVNRMGRKYNRELAKDVKNVKGLTLAQIAQEILCGYKAYIGEYNKTKLISENACVYVMDKLLKNNRPSFIPKESMCVKTSKEVLKGVNQIRRNALKTGAVNNERIAQLIDIINMYEKELAKQNVMDEEFLLKSVSDILEKLTKDELTLIIPWIVDCDIAKPSDYEMTGLEEGFVSKTVALGDKKLEQLEFFDEISKDVSFKFFKAYGIANEVEYIVDCIEREGLQYGEVNVLYGSAEYANYIQGAFESKGIPYRFVTGMGIGKTDVIQFLLSILDWAEDDYLYEKLSHVVDNPQITFNKHRKDEDKVKAPSYYYNRYLNKGIGWGKQRYIDCVNRVKENEEEAAKYEAFNEFLLDIVAIFEDVADCGKVYEELIDLCNKYIRKSEGNNKLLKVLEDQKDVLNQIEILDGTEGENALCYIREYIKEIQMGVEGDTESVSVRRIGNFEVLERTNNFVIGLSAKQFAADTKESAVLSDKELEMYIEGKVECAKDVAVNARQKLSDSFATLSKGEIIMGYSMFDTVELKESSPSVFYLEYFEKYGTGQEDVKSYDVVKCPILCKGSGIDKRIASTIADETVPGDEELVEEELDEEKLDEENKAISMSASRLQTLLACPLRYYYRYVDFIAERDQLEKHNSSWLNVAARGNLFHRTMEEYCNRVIKQDEITEYKTNEEEFENIYVKEVNKMVEEVPYISQVIFEKEKEENKEVYKRFLESFYTDMETDYNLGKKWRVLGCEVAFDEVKYILEAVIPGESDIELIFNGNIDRLDGYLDESCKLHLRVIDYKTGAKFKKEKEVKENKQIQHFVYALAIQSYVDNNKESLKAIFGRDITSYEIEEVSYIFPYEHSSNEKYSVMDKVKANMEAGKYNMPKEVNIKAWKVLHSIKGQYNKAVLSGIVCSEEKWEAACEYCKYTRLCRMKMGNEL